MRRSSKRRLFRLPHLLHLEGRFVAVEERVPWYVPVAHQRVMAEVRQCGVSLLLVLLVFFVVLLQFLEKLLRQLVHPWKSVS